MADKSPIEWTDATWNPIVGCSIVSPGCTNCYAMKMAGRIEAMARGGERSEQGSKNPGAKHYAGTTKKVNGNTVWTGKLALAPEKTLLQPLAWRAPRRIFVNSMGDLFHEDVPDEWIDRVFAVMALAPQHTFQVLTKRAKRMREYFAETWQRPARAALEIDGMTIPAQPVGVTDRWHQIDLAIDRVTEDTLFDDDRFWTPQGSLIGRPAWPRQPLPNVWLGISAERQQEADERIPDLLATPAAIRFVSAEPLLGPINFRRIRVAPDHHTIIDALEGYAIADAISGSGQERTMLDWIIAGGESGHQARAMHPAWPRSIRDQCAAAGVSFFFKQWGEWRPSTPEQAKGNPRSGWRCLAAHPHVPKVDELYPEAGAEFVENMGKKAAGRMLDGVEHNAMPGPIEVPAL
ncbi:phage Gp37/Gp68 family protein [Mesorhizobium sp. B2-3-4]|uniref:phage Gp37/Gp68 family protein n=1 Tax=Mesorhizobium sp. B2-3-4 TaxID=2589959 RepID=UPI00112E18D2|nr:phage Gp37/Gp68 family protein [Mesorhizobium sp. B2-3-4]TPM41575.1 phage Gp37/Gp68 family protein [Mesorhizobium sp. B2-3-4]